MLLPRSFGTVSNLKEPVNIAKRSSTTLAEVKTRCALKAGFICRLQRRNCSSNRFNTSSRLSKAINQGIQSTWNPCSERQKFSKNPKSMTILCRHSARSPSKTKTSSQHYLRRPKSTWSTEIGSKLWKRSRRFS